MRILDSAIASIALMLFGLAVAVYAREFDLGELDQPGSGFMPALAGAVIFFSAAVGLAQALRSHPPRDTSPVWQGGKFTPHAVVLAMVFMFGALIERVGFLTVSLLLVISAMRVFGRESWLISIAWAIGITLFSYLLLGVALKLELPRGVLF